MHYEIEVEGRIRRVVIDRRGGGFAVEVDGRRWRIDAARIDLYSLSLIVAGQPQPGEAGDGANLPAPAGGTGPDPSSAGGRSYDVAVAIEAAGRMSVRVGPTLLALARNGRRRHTERAGSVVTDGPQRVTAPMPGKIVRVLVAAGDTVQARQPLIVVEAMKMENELRADRAGTVAGIHVEEGASVEAGARLMDIR